MSVSPAAPATGTSPTTGVTTQAVRVHTPGAPSCMVLEEVPLPALKASDLLVDVHEAGVNFMDTFLRSGTYPAPLPLTLGHEGAGVVAEVGSALAGKFAVGDRVVFLGPASYATKCVVSGLAAIKMPAGVSFKQAVAVHAHGLTAHMCITDVYRVQEGDVVLVHAAAGGTGSMLVQMCKIKGATVIATVGSADKAALAKEAGADHVINYSEHDFVAEVARITDGKGVHVAYDGVGKATFDATIKCMRKRGYVVTYGAASGPIAPVDTALLMRAGSVFLTRPSLFDYIGAPGELQGRVADVHAWLGEGKLKQRIALELPLAQAAQAHEAVEARKWAGKILLNVQ